MSDRPSSRDRNNSVPHSPSSPAASQSSRNSRRRFLFALGVTGAGAVTTTASTLAANAGAAAAPTGDRATGGYQETEHVRNYYATARI